MRNRVDLFRTELNLPAPVAQENPRWWDDHDLQTAARMYRRYIYVMTLTEADIELRYQVFDPFAEADLEQPIFLQHTGDHYRLALDREISLLDRQTLNMQLITRPIRSNREAPLPASSESISQQNPPTDGNLADPWSGFKLFGSQWDVQQSFVSLTGMINISEFKTSFPVTQSQSQKPAVNAIVFDGSSHARSWARGVSMKHGRYRTGFNHFFHPSQSEIPIFLIGDMVHLIKRIRNSAFSAKPLFFAPTIEKTKIYFENAKISQPCRNKFWKYHAAKITVDLWKKIWQEEQNSVLRLARFTRSAIDLTSRSKMSFPLAKSVLNQRVALAFNRQRNSETDPIQRRAYRNAATLCIMVSKILARTRSRIFISGRSYLDAAAKQIFSLIVQLNDWRERNAFLSAKTY